MRPKLFLILLASFALTRVSGEGETDENAILSSTSTEISSTTTELIESSVGTSESSISTTESSVSTSESSVSTPESSTSTIDWTTAETISTTSSTSEVTETQVTTEETTVSSTPVVRPEENELQSPSREFKSSRETSGAINSFQDILKKVDNLATNAVMGNFEKEEIQNPPPPPSEEAEKRLSNEIRATLQYYKDYRKVAIPGADIPDPFPVPNFSRKMGGTPFSFYNTSMYGMSNYEIVHINTNLEKMQVYVEVFMPRLVILGNYTAKSWFKKAAGPFNVTLLDVTASGAAALSRDEEGNLMASDSEMDMSFKDGRVDFKNLGIMGSLLQGVLSTAAPLLFEGIKPAIMGEINEKIRVDVNKRMKLITTKFVASNASTPLNSAIDEAKQYIKTNGYDPFRIQNYVLQKSVLLVNVSEFTLTGVSEFYKASDIEFSMDNGTLELGLHIASRQLHGRCRWLFSLGKRFSRTGWSNFTVDYIQTKFYVTQSLDITEHPQLRKLDVNVGKITLDMSGMGKLDIVAETLVNTLPDLLRHIIVDAIEIPVSIKAQEILDKINVEEIVNKNLPELDRIGL